MLLLLGTYARSNVGWNRVASTVMLDTWSQCRMVPGTYYFCYLVPMAIETLEPDPNVGYQVPSFQ